MEYIFELEMQVRDYECDMEGIVNNAIYQHYLEHTRHEFLASSGISFIEMHERGVDPVVNRIEINYKTPLRSRDKFISKLYMRRAGIKYVFLSRYLQDFGRNMHQSCRGNSLYRKRTNKPR